MGIGIGLGILFVNSESMRPPNVALQRKVDGFAGGVTVWCVYMPSIFYVGINGILGYPMYNGNADCSESSTELLGSYDRH